MKKSFVKGFTLIELVVVIALFGLIMATALAMLGPVTNVFKSTAMYEESAAIVDNVSMYIEDNVRYANRINIYNKAFVDPSDEQDFIDAKITEMCSYYCFDKELRASEYIQDEKIYVLKIDNPDEVTNLDADSLDLAHRGCGKLSLWTYQAYDPNRLSKYKYSDSVINKQFYTDYSFTTNLGTYNKATDTYTFDGASAFCLNINLFHNDKKYGEYVAVTNTKLDNEVSFSLDNVYTTAGALEEKVMVYTDVTKTAVKELPDKQFRYDYKETYGSTGSDAFVQEGNDIYLFYTKCPELQKYL